MVPVFATDMPSTSKYPQFSIHENRAPTALTVSVPLKLEDDLRNESCILDIDLYILYLWHRVLHLWVNEPSNLVP